MMTMLNGFRVLPVLCVFLSLSLCLFALSLSQCLPHSLAGIDFVWVRSAVLSFELKICVFAPKKIAGLAGEGFFLVRVSVCVCVPPQSDWVRVDLSHSLGVLCIKKERRFDVAFWVPLGKKHTSCTMCFTRVNAFNWFHVGAPTAVDANCGEPVALCMRACVCVRELIERRKPTQPTLVSLSVALRRCAGVSE